MKRRETFFLRKLTYSTFLDSYSQTTFKLKYSSGDKLFFCRNRWQLWETPNCRRWKVHLRESANAKGKNLSFALVHSLVSVRKKIWPCGRTLSDFVLFPVHTSIKKVDLSWESAWDDPKIMMEKTKTNYLTLFDFFLKLLIEECKMKAENLFKKLFSSSAALKMQD